MSNIERFLNLIKTAVYGREVRDAIHDSIAECYSESSDAMTLANNVSNTANTALTTANKANDTANTASTTANNASNTANTALTTANKANDTASTALTNANKANDTANAASTTANNASNTANTASTTANNASNTANTALTTANETKQGLTQTESRLYSSISYISGGSIIEFIKGKYIDCSVTPIDYNNPIDNNLRRYVVLNCSEGDEFTINVSGTSKAKPYVFCDDNGNPKVSGKSGTYTDEVIKCPNGATKLILNDTNSDNDSYIGKLVKLLVRDNATDLQEIRTELQETKDEIANTINRFSIKEVVQYVKGRNNYDTGYGRNGDGRVNPYPLDKFFKYTGDVVFTSSDWSKYRIFFFIMEANEDGTLSVKEKSGWKTSDYTMPANTLFRFEVAYQGTEPATLTDAQFQELSTAIEILNPNISDKIDDISQIIEDTRRNVAEYPKYVADEIDRVSFAIKEKLVLGNIVIFGFNTDQHLNASPLPVIYGLRALNVLTKKVPFNLVCLGGDSPGYDNDSKTVDGILRDVLDVNEPLLGAETTVVSVTGNHDAHQNNNDITNGQMYKCHFGRSAKHGVVHKDKISTNGYYDDMSCNIRFVFCDTTSRPGYENVESCREWLDHCLNTLPDGYKAIALSHHALTSAYNGDYEGNTTGLWSGINCQSTLAKYADKIICCISGHWHRDSRVVDSNGINYIVTTCAGTVSINPDDHNARVAGTASETAFDVFCIDQDARKIYTIRYGAGGASANREFTY